MKRTGTIGLFLAGCLAGCAHVGDRGEGPRELASLVGNSADKAASTANDGQPSFFTRLWELDGATRTDRSTIAQHRSNYFLPISYNDSPNVAPLRAADPGRDLENIEALFQISFKVKIWEDLLASDMDLWFGYTQRSFWQIYDFDDSSPFRETNYEPELLLNWRTKYDLFGLKGRFVNLGLNHQSNGQSDPLSRSWNRVVANVGLESGPLALELRGWQRIPESSKRDDNPRIEKYLGYGEIWGHYFLERHRLGLMLRNNLDCRKNRGALQLEWSFPLFSVKSVSGYIQYFNGHGESLLDYDHQTHRISAGLMLTL